MPEQHVKYNIFTPSAVKLRMQHCYQTKQTNTLDPLLCNYAANSKTDIGADIKIISNAAFNKTLCDRIAFF